jgi:hypothetical protein
MRNLKANTLRLVFLVSLLCIAQDVSFAGAVEDLLSEYQFDSPMVQEALNVDDSNEEQSKKDASTQQQELQTTDNVLMYQVKAEFWSLLMLSGVAIFALSLQVYLIQRTQYTVSDLIHASALIMLIYGTVFLTIKASETHQLTGPIGILAALAGYLFGQTKKGDSGGSEKGEQKS